MLDLVVLAAVLLGAFTGWRRGFIVPLVATGGTLIGLYALYSGGGAGLVPSGTAGLGLGAGLAFIGGGILGRIGATVATLVHRFTLLKRADQGLGVPLGALLALVTAYFALTALVSFDGVIAPFHGKATVDAAAVAAVRAAVTAQPQFGLIADPAMLDEMATSVAKAAIPRDQIAKYAQALAFYEEDVRPQLLQSLLAPLILAVGEHLPVVGRHVDYPRS